MEITETHKPTENDKQAKKKTKQPQQRLNKRKNKKHTTNVNLRWQINFYARFKISERAHQQPAKNGNQQCVCVCACVERTKCRAPNIPR